MLKSDVMVDVHCGLVSTSTSVYCPVTLPARLWACVALSSETFSDAS